MDERRFDKLLKRHEAFLQCAAVDRPLVGNWFGGYFPAEQYPAGLAAWQRGQSLAPEDVNPAAFAADYERLHQAHQNHPDDFFFVASPYWGIPWLEAILGCAVTVEELNCRAAPFPAGHKLSFGEIDLSRNVWFQLLMRFTDWLTEFSAGRFPVCAPLLRGPGDCTCAMLGGTEFLDGFLDHPEQMQRILTHCAAVRLAVLRQLHRRLPPWRDTFAGGGYPSRVWGRQRSAYHQEDSAALLNPELFREHLLPLLRQMTDAAVLNFIHLHSACLYPLDILLADDTYDVIQINIDHAGTGPALAELIPALHKVQQAGYPLVLWGELPEPELELLGHELSPVGLSLQPIRGGPK